MRRCMLKWPWVTVALFLSGILSLGPAQGAPLHSQLAASSGGAPALVEMEKEMVAARLASLGLDRDRIYQRLSDPETGRLVLSLHPLLAGGAQQEKKAAGVAVVIIIVLATITGLYLFYDANK